MDYIEAPIEDFENGWHRQISKNHIWIWSDQWMENMLKDKGNIDCEKIVKDAF